MPKAARIQPSAAAEPGALASFAHMHEAEIVSIGPTSVEVRIAEPRGPRPVTAAPATVAARLAVAATTYVPTVGDRVVVVGNGETSFVVGVVSAAQTATRLEVTGDLELTASGKLRLTGQDGVEITGAEVQVRAGKLEMFARKVTQRYDELRQRVVGLLAVEAGSTHTVVDGASFTRAESATILTKEKVSINGKSIHLG